MSTSTAHSKWTPPPEQPKKTHKIRNVFLGGVAAVGAIIIATSVAGGGGDHTSPQAPASTSPQHTASGPKASFGPGTYKVGEDIAAGTYKTSGSQDLCYWERARNDSGSMGAIITNNAGTGPDRVTVNTGEVFKTSGCDWHK